MLGHWPDAYALAQCIDIMYASQGRWHLCFGFCGLGTSWGVPLHILHTLFSNLLSQGWPLQEGAGDQDFWLVLLGLLLSRVAAAVIHCCTIVDHWEMLWWVLHGFEYHGCCHQCQCQMLCVCLHFWSSGGPCETGGVGVLWWDGGVTINDGNHHCGVHDDWNSYVKVHRFDTVHWVLPETFLLSKLWVAMIKFSWFIYCCLTNMARSW